MTPMPIGRTRRTFCASVLVVEGFVVLFAVLVASALSDLSTTVVVSVGTALAIGCLITAGLLRYRWAYVVGSALQVLLVLYRSRRPHDVSPRCCLRGAVGGRVETGRATGPGQGRAGRLTPRSTGLLHAEIARWCRTVSLA